jgi:hypothetical protein
LRRGSRRLLVFDDVDVAVLIERAVGAREEGDTLPMPVVVRAADRKDPFEVHDEVRRAQETGLEPGSASIEAHTPGWLQSVFFRLPAPLRDLLFWRWLLRNPVRVKRTMGTVVVTSVGMAAPGVLAWGIPLSLHPLGIAVGGIAKRGEGEHQSEILALTVVFDHAVVDGAPVGRFVRRLQQLLNDPGILEEAVRRNEGDTQQCGLRPLNAM